MNTQTAAMLRVDHLDNYQVSKADRLRQVALLGRIYFSNPNDFNDPWDCRPRYNEDALDDSAYCERLVNWLDVIARKWAPKDFDESLHNDKINQLRTDRPLLKSHLLKAADARENVIHQRYRIYCLSS